MLLRLSEQEQLEMEDVIFHLAHPEQLFISSKQFGVDEN